VVIATPGFASRAKPSWDRSVRHHCQQATGKGGPAQSSASPRPGSRASPLPSLTPWVGSRDRRTNRTRRGVAGGGVAGTRRPVQSGRTIRWPAGCERVVRRRVSVSGQSDVSRSDASMKTIALGMIRLYQRTLSRVLPPTCRFYPSCSQYAYEAIARYGVIRGGWLAIGRLSRCHPFNPGGYDPVR